MPTQLPKRRRDPKQQTEAELRPLLFAGLLLIAVLTCVCVKFFPPTPGYALAAAPSELQLSP